MPRTEETKYKQPANVTTRPQVYKSLQHSVEEHTPQSWPAEFARCGACVTEGGKLTILPETVICNHCGVLPEFEGL